MQKVVYAECRVFIGMLSVIMLSVVMLIVVVLIVVMLIVVALLQGHLVSRDDHGSLHRPTQVQRPGANVIKLFTNLNLQVIVIG
jgi:hypothetical protein